jgi:PAS domain S-box-containing protein
MLVGQCLRNTTGQIVDFQLIKANPAAVALTGLSTDALYRRTVLELDPDIQPTGFFQRCVAAVERGEPFRSERPFGEHWYDVSIVRVADDCFLSTFLVIDEQKRAERQARQTTDLLQGVLNATPLAINHLDVVLDEVGEPEDFVFRLVNPASERIGKQAAADLIGRRLTERYPNVRETGIFDAYARVWKTGEPWRAELPYEGDGLTGWFSFLVTHHGDGLVTVINDITDRKRAELDANRQAELANNVLNAALVGISTFEAVRDEQGVLVDLRYKSINDKALSESSLTAADVLEKHLTEVFPGVRESGLFERYRRVIETGTPERFELQYNYDGFDNYTDVQAAPFGPDGLIIQYTYITDRKRAELRQAELTNQLRAILANTPVGIALMRSVRNDAGELVDLQWTLVNDSTARTVLLPGDNMTGKRLLELFPNVRTMGAWDVFYKKTVESGQPQLLETYYEGEGIKGWYRLEGTPYGDGMLLTLTDITDRKEAELQVRRQARLLEDIVENTQAGIVLFEAVRDQTGAVVDFRYRISNAVNSAVTGRPRPELEGQRMLELFPSTRPTGFFDRMRTVLETDQPAHYEQHYQGDGLDHWLDISLTPLDDGVLFTYLDITERKRAELEIKRQSELLRGVIDNVQVGIGLMKAVRDEAGAIVDFRYELTNQGNADLTGLSVETMTGGLMTKLLPGTVESGFLDFFAEITEKRESRRIEFPYAADGIDGWFDMTAVPHDDGVLFSSLNITAIRQAQRAQQRQAELFDGIINNALNGIIYWQALRDQAGRIADLRAAVFNQAGCDMARITPEQFRTRTFLQLDPEGLFRQYAAVIETGHPLRTEYFFEDIDTWFDVTAARLGDGVVVSFSNVTPLKRAEQTQSRQAQLFNQILNTSLNGILLLQPARDAAGKTRDFRVRLFNQAAHDLTGLPWEWAQTRTLLDMHASIGTSGLLDAAVLVLETGDPLRVEFFFEPVARWFDVSVARLGDELVVTFSDISAVRESVIERQRHAAQLQALLDGSINAILACEAIRDPEESGGDVVDFYMVAGNRAVEVMLARPLEEVVGRRLLTEYPGNVPSGSFQRYKDTVLTGQPQRFELYYHADGLDTWFDISTVKHGDGLIISFLDVSEAKRAQQALLGESILFKTLSSHVPDTGVLVVNPSQRVLFANGELPEALLNPIARERLPQKRLSEIIRSVHRAEVQGSFRQALAGESRQVAAQFGEAFYEVFFGPVENQDGQVVMAMATFRNVTRDRLYQQQLQRSNENLERFAYVASHDLQEPLRKIQAFGDLLARKHGASLDAQGADLIRRMQESASRMNELIRDLLTYSRVSSKTPEFQTVLLDNLLAYVRVDLDWVLREKNATLRIDPLPVVQGDATQLRQLFHNLLSNALKFSRPGVPPAVEVRYRLVAGAETAAVLLLQPDARFHEISVSDNGIGFDEQYAERIFEAFQRLHGRGEYPGTGVGLAIVKKVVENHRGSLSVSSQPGEGSTFRVYLPTEGIME